MLFLFIGLGCYVVFRGAESVLGALRGLPRSNEDWVWY